MTPPVRNDEVKRGAAGGATPQRDRGASLAGRNLIELDPRQRATIDILVVDDEPTLRRSCASILSNQGFPVTECGRGDEALRMVKRGLYDIVVVDLFMSQVSGREILGATLETNPDTIVIVITGHPGVESSVEVLREGAWDYLPKPFSATHFDILIGRAAHAVIVARESRKALDLSAARRDEGFDLLGRSSVIGDVVELVKRVARTDASVFITGESGAGKEVVAQLIHQNSRRSSREMIPLNCAAIPETLVESEMFGHVEGAFTGAVREKQGLLEAANGGTLFLDEISDLPLTVQAKLLRVLQDGVVRRVGSVKTDAVVNVPVESRGRQALHASRRGAALVW